MCPILCQKFTHKISNIYCWWNVVGRSWWDWKNLETMIVKVGQPLLWWSSDPSQFQYRIHSLLKITSGAGIFAQFDHDQFFQETLQTMKTWATILTFVIIQMLIWLFLFQDNKNMFCTVQKIFYHHGVLRQTSTVSRLQTWCWSILQIFVSILVNLLVNVQRFQVCKDAVESTKWNFKSTPWSILP